MSPGRIAWLDCQAGLHGLMRVGVGKWAGEAGSDSIGWSHYLLSSVVRLSWSTLAPSHSPPFYRHTALSLTNAPPLPKNSKQKHTSPSCTRLTRHSLGASPATASTPPPSWAMSRPSSSCLGSGVRPTSRYERVCVGVCRRVCGHVGVGRGRHVGGGEGGRRVNVWVGVIVWVGGSQAIYHNTWRTTRACCHTTTPIHLPRHCLAPAPLVSHAVPEDPAPQHVLRNRTNQTNKPNKPNKPRPAPRTRRVTWLRPWP